jgi:hypothetical protein
VTLYARQITLVGSTITPLIVAGAALTGTTFVNVNGSTQDPLPCRLRNADAAAVVWIGGPDVSATKGTSLKAGETLTMNLYGSSEIPYAFSTGTPIVEVLLGRQ